MRVDILEVVPSEVRIQLQEESLRKLFQRALEITGNKKKLAQVLSLNRFSLYRLLQGISKPKAETLRKLIELTKMEIKDEELTLSVEASKNSIRIKRYIEIDEDFMWFIGIWEGDNADNSNSLGIGSTDLGIIRRALGLLKRLVGEDKISVRLEFPSSVKITQTTIDKIVKGMDIQNYKSLTSTAKKRRKKLFIEVKVYSVALKKTFLQVKEIAENKLLEMSHEIKKAFLQGFFDAEGTINIKKGIAVYWQKDTPKGRKNLELARRILTSLGIASSKIKTHSKKRNILRLDVLKGRKGENILNFIKIGSTSFEKHGRMRILRLLLLRQ
jgi:DNA-binding phage protein